MPAIINLAAEFGAEYIGNASVVAASVPAIHFKSQATESEVLKVSRTVLGSPSIALVALDLGSAASAPALKLVGQSFVSCVSIVFAASANWGGLGAVRVEFSDGITYGWIPVIPSASVTAA